MSAVGVSSLALLLIDPFFVAAMIVCAAATISWILVLRSVPLAAAYSFTAPGFIMVPILSRSWPIGTGLSFGGGTRRFSSKVETSKHPCPTSRFKSPSGPKIHHVDYGF
jgi:hypothetical protein